MQRLFTFKKTISVALVLGYFIALSLGTYFSFTPIAGAAETTRENLCIPQFNKLNGDLSVETGNEANDEEAEHFSPAGGWLEVRIINRASIQVSMVNLDGKKCRLPVGPDLSPLDLSYIHPDEGSGSFPALVNSVLIDRNLDDNFDYRFNAGKNSDDNQIDNFGTFPDSSKLDGKRIQPLSTTELEAFFQTAELVLGIEEDLIPSVECSGGNNNNFFLRRINDEMQWGCNRSLLDNYTGISIGALTGNSIVQSSKKNFNIVYTISEDGKALNNVATNSNSSDSFKWCESPLPAKFKNGSCTTGNLEITDYTPEQLVAMENNPYIELNIKDTGGGPDGKTVAAGYNTEQGQEADNLLGARADADGSCEANGGSFSFVICPLLEMADGAVATLDGKIFDALLIEESSYGDDRLRESWARIRNIGYVLLIPVMLVMVIGTALNFSFVDAYTVKRAMPRLFIAIIFMALSFDLSVILINVVNGVGQGIAGLITSPFGGLEKLQLADLFNPDGLDNGLVVGGAIAFAAAGYVGIGIIASYLFVAALLLLAVFVLLALRRVLIVGLILIAPLAIISWIFPGNDKLWKLWWNSFSKLLYLFPIIIALLASGRVFASIVNSSESGIFGTVIKLTAFVGPYFFIPAAFKFAGGAFGNIAGMVNDRSKGVFDKQRKYRQGKVAENKQKGDNFSRFSDGNKLGRGLNTAIGATRGKNLRSTMRGRAGINKARAAGQINQGAENIKNDPIYNANQNDDNFLVALADSELAEEKLRKYQDKAKNGLTLEDRESARTSAHAQKNGLDAAKLVKSRNSNSTRRQAFNALAKTGYQFATGEEGYNQVAKIADSIAGGDMGARSAMMDEAQYHLKNAGRFDLGGINHGNGYDIETGIGKAGLYQLANGKKNSIEAWGEDVMNSGDSHRISTHLAELKAMQPNTTGANQEEVNRQIKQIESSGPIDSYQKQSSGRIDPSTGAQKQTFERFDVARGNVDTAYKAKFTQTDIDDGGRMRDETMLERTQAEARAYERPDPNNMN